MREEELVAHRIVHRTRQRACCTGVERRASVQPVGSADRRDGDREMGHAVREIRRPVERIDDPADRRSALVEASIAPVSSERIA